MGDSEEIEGCAAWCSTYTCEQDECTACTAPEQSCSPPPPPPVPYWWICEEWCSEWTCEKEGCVGCGIDAGCKRPSRPPPPFAPPAAPSPQPPAPNAPGPRCERWCSHAPAGWDRKCRVQFGSPQAACADCPQCSPPGPRPPRPPSVPPPWTRPPKPQPPPQAAQPPHPPRPPPAPLTSGVSSPQTLPQAESEPLALPFVLVPLLVVATAVGGVVWRRSRRRQRDPQRARISSEAGLTAGGPDDDAQSDVKPKGVRRVRPGRRPKAQRVSAHEPTDDFAEDSTEGGIDQEQDAAAEEQGATTAPIPLLTATAEPCLMSIAQLRAELEARGIDTSDFLEKDEMVRRLYENNAERARAESDARVVV